jgi:hypothetical protein
MKVNSSYFYLVFATIVTIKKMSTSVVNRRSRVVRLLEVLPELWRGGPLPNLVPYIKAHCPIV